MTEPAEELPQRTRDTARWLVAQFAEAALWPLPLATLSPPHDAAADNQNQQQKETKT